MNVLTLNHTCPWFLIAVTMPCVRQSCEYRDEGNSMNGPLISINDIIIYDWHSVITIANSKKQYRLMR